MTYKKKLNVMLGDFSYYNNYTINSKVIPLGIGFIGQYAKQKFGDDIKISLYKKVDKFFEEAIENPPDVVGLALYYWANYLNKSVVKRLRKLFKNKVKIIIGGPSIDSDKEQQKIFLKEKFPEVDAIVINEGEIAFSNGLNNILSVNKFDEPIEGISFLKDNQIISGKPIGTSTDLTLLGSPYLSGLLDDFLHSDYQPIIQTSRFCPYTCTFCVSGKNRGKLRGFPLNQVYEELKFISKKFSDRPHHLFRIADENFGILKRDIEIAEELLKCKKEYGFPQRLFFYNDKRFTEISRKIVEIIGDMCQYGMTLSLQTENPESLKAINRRNVTDEEIDDAIKWATKLNMPTTTELIFGLPYETKSGFVDLLNKSIDRGFDTILAQALFIMDGIELNRPDQREKYKFNTKVRPLSSSYGYVNDEFVAEHEEVVTSSETFSEDDFIEIRKMCFMFFSAFTVGLQKWFFQFVKNYDKDLKLTDIFHNFMHPNREQEWPKEYLDFLDDFDKAIKAELFDSREQMIEHFKKVYKENNNQVAGPTRLNINFVSRLIYLEKEWLGKVLLKHFKDLDKTKNELNYKLGSDLINLGLKEIIDLKSENNLVSDFDIDYDLLLWKKSKFKKNIFDLKSSPKKISFLLDHSRKSQISSFKQRFSKLSTKDYYNTAIDFITPRTNLNYKLDYKI